MSNILNIEDKILFFGIPKCGLVSMDKFCKKNNFKTIRILESICNYRTLFPNHTFLIIIRNPWHRVVSIYFYWKKIKDNNSFKRALNLNEIPTFTEFVKLIPKIKAPGWNLSSFDIDPSDFDIIIKLEEIDVHFKIIEKLLGAEIPYSQNNKGDYEGSYRDYYTDETRELVHQYFKSFIDTFGYTF